MLAICYFNLMEDPEILEEFPGDTKRGKYPWDEWLDGKVRVLRKGEHYDTTTGSMRATASSAAKSAGKRLRTKAGRDSDGCETLIIQAYEADPAG
jgi:hypothetical protein